MDQFQQLNRAMRYIEAHLAEEIDFQQVAQLAGCSEYHFRRLFSFLAGMTLGEYIRRRRLSQAAVELRQSSSRVIDLAVTYGYASADAFARAFYKLHGVMPSDARREGVVLKAVPPMTFQLTVQGAEDMDYRIVEKGAFQIVGLKKRVRLQYEGVNPEIAAMWASLTMDDIRALKAMSNTEPTGLVSASINFAEGRGDGSELDQYIGAATTHWDAAAGKWAVLDVPASTWGVFTARGKFPETLQNVWARIYGEWFAMSGYEISVGPEMLWNEHPDTSAPDFHSEIWIPIVKKMG